MLQLGHVPTTPRRGGVKAEDARLKLLRLGKSRLTIALAIAAFVPGLGGLSFARCEPTAASEVTAMTFPAKVDLNGRDGPSLDANVVKIDMYKAGQPVNVRCQDRGAMAYGSTIWDKTTDDVWVPDAYVKTGVDGYKPGVPRCSDLAQNGRTFAVAADLNGRAGPSLSARLVEGNMYTAGDQVTVVCQIEGTVAYGSKIWDKTDDDVYVPDAFVRTGHDGKFTPGLGRCSNAKLSQYGFRASVDLAGRNARSTSAAEVKTYAAGSTVYIVCQAIGNNAYGSNIWDKTVDNLWVADHYLKTGFDTFTPGVPKCPESSAPSGGGGGPTSGGAEFPTSVDLAGRKAKSTTAAEIKTYPAGSKVRIVCQAYGGWAYGSHIWDKTSDQLWVADYYLKTGTVGFLSNMPRCDDDPPSGGGGGGGGGNSKGDCRDGHGRIGGPAGPKGGTAGERVARVLKAAQSMTGKGLNYSWGGGGKGGPSCGISSPSPGGYVDYNRYGFDCSGYTAYAFWHGAGVDIGPNTGSQYSKGRRLPYSQRKPGDLLFWFEGGVSVHVAIYAGNGQMYEAAPPRDAKSVHRTAVYGSHSQVVRVIG